MVDGNLTTSLIYKESRFNIIKLRRFVQIYLIAKSLIRWVSKIYTTYFIRYLLIYLNFSIKKEKTCIISLKKISI